MVNVVKSSSVPKSLSFEKLKIGGSYREKDVVDQVASDFNNKCYLCEDKDITSINVEHFRPHKGDIDKKFDWNNLFFCCSHCNNIKLAKIEYDDILDCTSLSIEIIKQIKIKIDPWPKSRVIVEPKNYDIETIHTASLLEKVYNGEHTALKLHEGKALRKKVIKEVSYFIELLTEYDNDELSPEEKEEFKLKIRRKLSLASPFTAFKFWIIFDTPELFDEFKDLLP